MGGYANTMLREGNGREDACRGGQGALDAVMKDIEKQYGKGIVTVLGEEAAQAKVGDDSHRRAHIGPGPRWRDP